MTQRLLEETDNSDLVLFRFLFGFLACVECTGKLMSGWVQDTFVAPEFTFTEPGFEWLQPLPTPGMHLYYAALALAALGVAIGLYYRVAISLFTALWTGAYLMQRVHYNNHYYLILLLGVLLAVTPAHRGLSLDSRRRTEIARATCPRWCRWIFRFQIAVLYIYAGIAKLNPDWLAAKPVQIWLAARSQLPYVGWFYGQSWLKWVIAYGGIAFDLSIIPLLLFRRTRVLGLVLAVIFHSFNAFTFGIGIFPWLALSLMVFFFPMERIRSRLSRGLAPVARTSSPPQGIRWRRPALFVFLGVYCALQVLLPLRHHLYEGNVHWTEEGHRMSWHMMLRTKTGVLRYSIRDPASGKSWDLLASERLSRGQARKITTRPDMIWQFAQRLAAEYAARGYPEVEIYVQSRATLNGRPLQEFIRGDVNLAREPWPYFGHAEWIVPLKEDDP